MVLDEGVSVVTTGAGNPGKYMTVLQEKGIKVLPISPSTALARRLEQAGADAIIGEGMEAGGHIGDLTTMVLVPQLSDAVSVPVIAAGGIADGRGIAAAFALGAEGVQLGTRFMCATECTIHPDVKKRLIKAKDRETMVTGYSTGHPVRVLKNKLAREIEVLDRANRPEEVEALGAGKLALAMREGDCERGSLMAGQCAAMVTCVQPAAEIVRELVTEAEAVLKGLADRVGA
jgi:enoyl-[acyl-carrier protein] reductase II